MFIPEKYFSLNVSVHTYTHTYPQKSSQTKCENSVASHLGDMPTGRQK